MTHHDDDETPKPDYEVGYCRPPKETQFKKGQSPNPTGRKRKPKSVQVQMQEVLAQKIPITEGGKIKRLPRQQVILLNLANKAAKGDLKAAAFVFNLLCSPEHADTDTIDQASLSPDDQAMFDKVLRELMGAEDAHPSESDNGIDPQSAEIPPRADKEESRPLPRAPEDEERTDED